MGKQKQYLFLIFMLKSYHWYLVEHQIQLKNCKIIGTSDCRSILKFLISRRFLRDVLHFWLYFKTDKIRCKWQHFVRRSYAKTHSARPNDGMTHSDHRERCNLGQNASILVLRKPVYRCTPHSGSSEWQSKLMW